MITLDQGGRGAADVSRIAVPRALADVVESAWTLPARGEPSAERWRVVADPNPHLLVQRLRDGRVRATVVGARSRFVDVDQTERAYTVAIRLAVGGLGALDGPPACELLDRGAPVADVFGAEGGALFRRLEAALEPGQAVAPLLDFLARRLRRTEVDWRIRGMMKVLRRTPGATVGAIARTMGVSCRTLREVTRDRVGLSPKQVQRIHRLLRTLSALRRSPGDSWSTVAQALGYADQPHFAHECRTLLGETPTRFLARGRAAGSYKTGHPPDR